MKLKRALLSISPLCRNWGGWSGRPQGAALTQGTSRLSVPHSLDSVLVSTSIKYGSYPVMYVVLHLHVWVSFCWWKSVPNNSTCNPWSCSSWREVRYETGSGCHQSKRIAYFPALCAKFRFEPAFHTEELFLEVRFDNTFWVNGHWR